MIVAFVLSLVFAADPVVIAAGTGVTLGSPDDVSTVHVRNPSVSAARELVVAWYYTESTKTNPSVKSCVYGKQGTSSVIEIECGTITNAPVVAAGGGGALVVYGIGKELVGARLVGGKVKKKTFTIASKMTIGLAVGWDGTRFWLAYGDGKDAFVQRVSAAGALVGKPEQLAGESPSSGNLHVVCAASCALITPWGSRSLAQNKLGAKTSVAVDHIWKLTMPVFATHPFFGADKYRSMPADQDITGAETSAGALVAWTRHDKPGARGFELAFVPADPADARHTPIVIADEYDPLIVALDDIHFALVASTYGPNGHLVAHTVLIDPKYFVNAPAPRPAMASGHITGADGKPAAGAKIQYRVVFANGTQRTSSGLTAAADGSYAIQHPAPDDHDPGQDVVEISVWANDGADMSEVRKATGASLDLVLRASAKVSLALGNANGAVATVQLDHLDDISTIRSKSVSWQKSVDVKDKIELTGVPAGRIEITARARDGRAAFLETTIVSGKPNRISMPLGKVGSLVVKFEGKQVYQPIAIVQGDEIKDLNNNHKKILELTDLPPGVHEIVFLSMPWQMTRRYTVKPRATDQVKLQFEADLPAGFVGLQVSDALTIEAIAPGSPAEKAGLYTGARIDQIDGTAPTDSAHARQLLRGKPGSNVVVEIGNSGKSFTIERSRGTGIYAPGGAPDLFAP